MRLYQMADPVRYGSMSTEALRETFLLQGMYRPGEIDLSYVDLDRAVLGLAVPLGKPLALETTPELRAEYFLERRELGILNVGGSGAVTADGVDLVLDKLDCAYIGRGTRSVTFASKDAAHPACFYLLSYPAHASHPTAMVRFMDLQGLALGATETANKRKVYKAIYREGIKSCQLVMGFTILEPGSAWNTMPPHTHMRRSEIYFYFDIDPAQRILHLMGPPGATSHIVVKDKEAIVSPGWSIHSGVGTASYTFCWGMGGENQAYDDMDPLNIADLK